MGNILDKTCREKKKKNMFKNFFSSEIRALNEVMSTTVVEHEGPHMTSRYGAYALRVG
jgi:hypothetical protein